MSEVNLAAALGAATGSSPVEEKKRKREKSLPFPPLAEVSAFSFALSVDAATQSCPPERMFSDPLHYQQTRVNFAKSLLSVSEAKVAELSAMTPEARTAERKAKLEKAAAARALKSETVKAGAAVIPSSACSRFCPPSVPFSIGAYRCPALSDFSIDSVLMSVAGSALLFGIGIEALP